MRHTAYGVRHEARHRPRSQVIQWATGRGAYWAAYGAAYGTAWLMLACCYTDTRAHAATPHAHHAGSAHGTGHKAGHASAHTSTGSHATPAPHALHLPTSPPPAGATGPASVRQAQAALRATRARQEALARENAQQARTVATSRALNEAALAAATQAKARSMTLSAATVDATAQLQNTEQQIADISDRIDSARAEQAALLDKLRHDARALAPILPLAERLSLYPSDTLLAAPLPQQDAVTGFLILRGLSRQMEQQALLMRARQARLDVLDHDLSGEMERLHALEQTQSQQRLVVQREAMQARQAQKRADTAASTAARQLQAATERASSLQDAIARLDTLEAEAETAVQKEKDRAAAIARETTARRRAAAAAARAGNTTPPPPPAPAQATGQDNGPGLPEHPMASSGLKPVAGTLVSDWGSPTESGPATGRTYRTPAGAGVRAPCTGGVDFAGTFRTYGQMVILNCGQHYRFVLAGLSVLSVETGQSLTKGAPVGQMGSSGSSATLFIQLRHGQKTVNPAPFL
ncbi:MAG: peptidoglycan DD-metalloendopeptidase family protein [Acetobacter sp.]|uniref:murein hydrolase activator EnvC family protein n=1 Tax=Acetobacter sp. TaxID=440 RepID=UPI0039E8B163